MQKITAYKEKDRKVKVAAIANEAELLKEA